MSTSRLIKEDDEYLYLECYVHNDVDERPQWLFNRSINEDSGAVEWTPRYNEGIEDADAGATYELCIRYRIHKTTNKVEYLNYSEH